MCSLLAGEKQQPAGGAVSESECLVLRGVDIHQRNKPGVCECMCSCACVLIPACVHTPHSWCFLLPLPRTLSPEDGVTVYFHAIVSRDFSFNPDKHRVCVRGGAGLGKEPWSDACEMNYTK